MNDRWLAGLARLAALVVFTTAALLVEGVCGRLGLLFPAAFFLAFYLGRLVNWPVGFCCGLVAALVAEVAWGRPGSVLLLLVPLQLAVVQWCRHGNRYSAFSQGALGLVVAIVYSALCLTWGNVGLFPPRLYLSPLAMVWRLLGSAAVGVLVFPLLAELLDFVHRKCELNPDAAVDGGHWIES